MSYSPSAMPMTSRWNPEFVYFEPKSAPTSVRARPYGALPRNSGVEPEPGLGYAHTCTTSTPGPRGERRTSAQPPTDSHEVTVLLMTGSPIAASSPAGAGAFVCP